MHLHYEVDGSNFTSAGDASGKVKSTLKKLGIDADIIRRVAICMYEGEINMVIHAEGGAADVDIDSENKEIVIVLADRGPGIPDVELAMSEGFSTATDSVRNLGFGAGMGLPNMNRHADSMSIDTVIGAGTTITMRVKM
jgi:anti-sigma regulatory factor (Ser/Thr protein kinase)